MKAGDRYLKLVEWSEDDGCYVGRCPGLMLGGIHGRDPVRVFAELSRAVEEWIRLYAEDGAPLPEPTAGRSYSGKFILRVDKALHEQLALDALREGTSLNTHCARVLRESRAAYGRSPGRRKAGPS